MTPDDKPYEPKYKGFDEAAAKRALDTVDAARKNPSAKGQDANAEYVDDGPEEAARRTGRTRADVEESVERANRQRKTTNK